MTATDTRPAATEPSLGTAIADELRALAALIETSPRLAEEIRHALNLISVRVLGSNPPAAIGDICVAAQRLGVAVDRTVRGPGTRADLRFGRHVLVWLHTSHDALPAGAAS
jgi:hypothetical protein